MNKTVLFTYDTAGNITERCEYAFTSKEGEALEELACTHHRYEYDGDRLMRYDDKPCMYDANGKMQVYCGRTATFDAMGRLQKYGETRMVYNGDGTRESKEYLTFTYDSTGRLIKQSDGLEFIYDNSGVIGVKYNNAQYFYRRDCQGNIIALIDSSGNVVVEYKYDAWGNHEATVADETYVALAEINPFRYRGYYYDEETGLYYLQTRYYDPEVGRFISRDSIEYADPETICGLNLYAYCGNNPVMATDPTGRAEWWEWLVAGIVIIASAVAAVFTAGTSLVVAGAFAGIAFGGTFSIVNQLITTGDFNLNRFALDALGGALSGALAATGIGILGQIAGNVAINAGGSVIYSLASGEHLTIETAINSIVNGIIGGAVGGRGVKFIKGIPSLIALFQNSINAMSKLLTAIVRSGFGVTVYTFLENLIKPYFKK